MTDPNGIPLGFAMALAQNQKALERFALLSKEEKKVLTETAKRADTKDEMQQIVESIINLQNFT